MAVMIRTLMGLVALLVAGAVTAEPSKAATTYYYTGPTYTAFSGIFDATMSISGWFTRSTAFLAGTTNAQDQGSPNGVTVFWFTDGVNTVHSDNATYWKIDINTFGPGGSISDWDLDLDLFTATSNIAIISHGHAPLDEVATGTGGTDFSSQGTASNFSTLGSWSVGPTRLAIPLPAAAWLFLTGLGMVGFAGWRRRRAA